MKYLEKPCTRCGAFSVVRPSVVQTKKQIILVKCDECGKSSRYNIVCHVDETRGYYLSKWGRGEAQDLVRVPRWIQRKYAKLSSYQIRLALDEKYGHTV